MESPIFLRKWARRLGHEDPATTHQYIEADLAMKENALRRLQPPKEKHIRFKPQPHLLQFLDSL